MGTMRHLAVGLCVCAVACAEANIGDGDGMPDGGIDPAADARPTADAAPTADAGPQTSTLTQSQSHDITPLNAVSCNNKNVNDPTAPFGHTDNSYYRVYDLSAASIASDFEVTSVEVVIEEAVGSGGTQSASVFLYTLPAAPVSGATLNLGDFTLLGSTTTDITDVTAQMLSIPLTATVPAGSILVVEFFTPNGQADNSRIFIGSNNLGQDGDSYLRADDCGVTSPTPAQTLSTSGGTPITMQIILDVTGTHF